MTFECHITAPSGSADKVKKAGKDLHWKFSAIDGDPVLGAGVHCYLTTHDATFARIKQRMKAAAHVLEAAGVEVIRMKIEAIMYDTKTGVGL